MDELGAELRDLEQQAGAAAPGGSTSANLNHELGCLCCVTALDVMSGGYGAKSNRAGGINWAKYGNIPGLEGIPGLGGGAGFDAGALNFGAPSSLDGKAASATEYQVAMSASKESEGAGEARVSADRTEEAKRVSAKQAPATQVPATQVSATQVPTTQAPTNRAELTET